MAISTSVTSVRHTPAELHWYEAHGTGRRKLKIKRFLEDEENISKAAQKIVKNRNKTESLVT